MRARRRDLLSGDEPENFWPSFTDLVSTISLILFVLVLLAYIQNLISGKQLAYVRSQLGGMSEQLARSEQQVSRSERRLLSLAAEIEAGQAQLALSARKVSEQESMIADSNRELGLLRARLQGIAVLRLDVLGKVKSALEGELRERARNGAPLVSIADNGNIVIHESLVFETNSHAVKGDAKPLLDTLANAFANVLADPKVRDNIDVIVVQGHTDERGTAAYNRELSGRRASAVLSHMFEANDSLEREFGGYFAASAYSEFRPIDPGKTEAAYQQNRRIELSVVLKDASVRSVIDEYMQGQSPAPSAPP